MELLLRGGILTFGFGQRDSTANTLHCETCDGLRQYQVQSFAGLGLRLRLADRGMWVSKDLGIRVRAVGMGMEVWDGFRI